jgi:hypothetical protein
MLHTEGDDLLVGIKADAGDAFADLTDVVRLRDWFNSDNQIETIRFDDGSTLDLSGVTQATSAGAVLGGSGSDLYENGGGDDIYQFGRGDGQDVIHDDYWVTQNVDATLSYQTTETYTYTGSVSSGPYTWTGALTGTRDVTATTTTSVSQTLQADGGNDVLELSARIVAADVRLMASGNDLLIGVTAETGIDEAFGGLADVVRLQDWYNSNNRIETLQLSDGTSFDLTDIVSGNATGSGGFALIANWADGSAGEFVTGGSGGDTLLGSVGADVITGSGGNDVIDGIGGDDTLQGGLGNDSYKFGRGDGVDLVDNKGEGASSDVVSFDAGIATDQLWFSQSGNDLVVNIVGTVDGVTVDDWYLDNGDNQVASFEISDGTELLNAQVENLVTAMSAYSPPALGETDLSQALHDGLDQVLADNWQSS